jgi:hypothetical protein
LLTIICRLLGLVWSTQVETRLTVERNVEVSYVKEVLVTAVRLCAVVVIVPGYRSRGPGSIPGATRFSER